VHQAPDVQGALTEVQGKVRNSFAARFHLASKLRVPAKQAATADSHAKGPPNKALQRRPRSAVLMVTCETVRGPAERGR
jgi:hypothetical protein